MLKSVVLGFAPIRVPALFFYRLSKGVRHTLPPLLAVLPWLLKSRETTNYTYDLSPRNVEYLCSTIAAITGRSYADVRRYADELEGDEELRSHIVAITEASEFRYRMDAYPRYGRRMGWYIFARVIKPRLIVETGVDKGLGSCVLTAALRRNAVEGYPGRYVGTDIDNRAGMLFKPPYSDFGNILFGDSIESLNGLTGPVDLFINDSDHSSDYEAREYEAIGSKMSPDGVILGDNCHVTDKLCQFALATGRRFVFFGEEPLGHWYRGAGIGIAFQDSALRALETRSAGNSPHQPGNL